LILTATGVLLLGPIAISGLATVAWHVPVPVRIALRDLSRYRARSGAALAAISLVTGIVAAIAVGAAAAAQNEGSPGAVGWTNLPANQLMIYLSPDGPDGTPEIVPARTTAQLTRYRSAVRGLAGGLHSTAEVPLDAAVATGMPALQEGPVDGRPTTMLGKTQAGASGAQAVFAVSQLYVATPALLRFYHLDPAAIRPGTDILTARSGLTGVKILDFSAIISHCKAMGVHCAEPGPHPGRHADGNGPNRSDLANPAIQVAALPHYTSAPNSLLTAHVMTALDLQPVLAGWLIQTPGALTAAQVTRADHWAAANGLTVETTTGSPQASLASVSDKAIAVGVLAVLAVLAMTIGLIRSETANDLRVLSATGASGGTRRLVTGTTAAALALLGGLIGSAAAYLGIIAWNRGVHSLANVPVTKLAVLIVGIPLAALAAGWLMAGHEPHAIARRPLD
jgi:putative ABC transport system permease protein